MIKNIIFDLSEVLISGYLGIENLLFEKHNIPKQDFLKQKEKTLPFFLDTLRGIHTEDEYLNILLKDTNWNITTNEFKVTIREYLNTPLKNMRQLIDLLKEKYNLILVSDYIKEWLDYINKHNDIMQKFNHTFISCDIGYLKTDDECFKYIIEKAGIKAEETIFIDDSIPNIESAQKEDIEGILFINYDNLIKELKKRNLL